MDMPSNPVFSAKVDVEEMKGQAKIWEVTFGMVTSMALKAAVLLDIPGIIARTGSGSGASLSVQDIASQLPSESPERGYLSRILRFLASAGILSETIRPSTSERCYGLNEASRCLVQGSHTCIAPMVLLLLDKMLVDPFHYLDIAVLERRSPVRTAHGVSLMEYARTHLDFGKLVNQGMAHASRHELTALLQIYDGFKCIHTLVDVGGGVGLALSLIVAAYPHIRGINYDLPEVVASAPPIAGVEHLGGNMFESVPCGDAIFLKSVMHDWGDDACIKILKNCWAALPPDGKLIVVDVVIEEADNQNKAPACMSDMLMLAHTDDGKERTREEWVTLLNAAGFQGHRFLRCGVLFWVIEAYRSPPVITRSRSLSCRDPAGSPRTTAIHLSVGVNVEGMPS